MARHERVCACGREAIDVLRVASEDGLLLVPVCEECSDTANGTAEERVQPFGRFERRPLTPMPSREADRQPPLPLDQLADVDKEHDAA